MPTRRWDTDYSGENTLDHHPCIDTSAVFDVGYLEWFDANFVPNHPIKKTTGKILLVNFTCKLGSPLPAPYKRQPWTGECPYSCWTTPRALLRTGSTGNSLHIRVLVVKQHGFKCYREDITLGRLYASAIRPEYFSFAILNCQVDICRTSFLFEPYGACQTLPFLSYRHPDVEHGWQRPFCTYIYS